MKIKSWFSILVLTVVLGFYQNCAEVVFTENPTIYSSDSASFDTSSMLGAEYYKVVLVLDPSSSMNDDLAKLSLAIDRVIEAAQGYNIRFYVYDTNSRSGVRIHRGLELEHRVISSSIEPIRELVFNLKNGTTVTRPLADVALYDWTSYEYKEKIQAPKAVFEFTKNSTAQDILNAKNQLRQIVTATEPINVSSNEYGICTIKRILSNTSEGRIIFPGDKVNFILISDENNGGLADNEVECSDGGVVIKKESEVFDKLCVQDFWIGSIQVRFKELAKDCNDNFDVNLLVSGTNMMEVHPILKVIERSVEFTYRSVDSIISAKYRSEVNYNFEEITTSQVACTTNELNYVKSLVLARTGSESNFISCNVNIQNSRDNYGLAAIQLTKKPSDSPQTTNLLNQTFLGKHCNTSAMFYDPNKNKTYESFKHAIADVMASDGIVGVDPNKISFSGCVQRLSISHLGVGEANPLAYVLNTTGEHKLKTFGPIKEMMDNLLSSDNYVISSIHHSNELDSGLCSLDPNEGTYGVNQDQMINSLGANGFKMSICSPDYSQSLIQFASRFIKDQHRTFTLVNHRPGTEILSLRINGKDVTGVKNSFRLKSNKLIIGEGLINQGDIIDVEFRYPQK